LTKENKQLNKQVSALEETQDVLTKEKKKLNNQVASLQETQNTLTKENKQLNKQVSALEETQDVLTKEQKDLTKQVASLQEPQKEKKFPIYRLNDEIIFGKRAQTKMEPRFPNLTSWDFSTTHKKCMWVNNKDNSQKALTWGATQNIPEFCLCSDWLYQIDDSIYLVQDIDKDNAILIGPTGQKTLEIKNLRPKFIKPLCNPFTLVPSGWLTKPPSSDEETETHKKKEREPTPRN